MGKHLFGEGLDIIVQKNAAQGGESASVPESAWKGICFAEPNIPNLVFSGQDDFFLRTMTLPTA
jgi:hypothetical protein